MTEAYRLPGLERATGYKGPTLYQKIKAGLFPAPVRLSQRHSIWPAHEVTAWLNAKTRGANDEEIRALVQRLQNERITTASN